MELYEISVVDIPANRKSIFHQIAKSLEKAKDKRPLAYLIPLSHLTPFPLLECREIILENMIYHAYKIRKRKVRKQN